MGDNCFRNVINLGNSIIGVSILAMPYCFQKCGIFLSILLIITSGLLTKATCHLLLKSAIKERRRNFEFLAFHTFGTVGKFAVEFGIIGFLLGSCIAFFVVIGDLSPPLFADFFVIENTPQLRLELLLFLGFFIALPLGLMRKLESLTSFSTISVCFYVFMVFKIFNQAVPNLSYEKLVYEMNWWRPSGLLSSLPIFAMALSCQTQLFEIFDTLNDPSLKRMDVVVSSAVHMCSSVYCLVGLFGYVAFYDSRIDGNILVKFPNTLVTKLVKMCFVTTVVVSFPLCLFPCRSSLHSLIFKTGVHDTPGNLIPDHRFRLLTFLLVAVTIGTAIMLPNIEFVLGILGSTIGTTICFILPALIFICNTTKNTNERIMAKVVLSVGIFILVACSYSTLHESAKSEFPIGPPQLPVIDVNSPKPNLNNKIQIAPSPDPVLIKISSTAAPPVLNNIETKITSKPEIVIEVKKPEEKRQEPPIPQEPDEPVVIIVEPKKTIKEKVKEIVIEQIDKKVDVVTNKIAVDNNKEVLLNSDALKKEDKELDSKIKLEKKDREAANKKQEEILEKIEMQQIEQKKLLEEQRKLLEELKEHKETHVKQDKEKQQIDKKMTGNEVNRPAENKLENAANALIRAGIDRKQSANDQKRPANIQNNELKQAETYQIQDESYKKSARIDQKQAVHDQKQPDIEQKRSENVQNNPEIGQNDLGNVQKQPEIEHKRSGIVQNNPENEQKQSENALNDHEIAQKQPDTYLKQAETYQKQPNNDQNHLINEQNRSETNQKAPEHDQRVPEIDQKPPESEKKAVESENQAKNEQKQAANEYDLNQGENEALNSKVLNPEQADQIIRAKIPKFLPQMDSIAANKKLSNGGAAQGGIGSKSGYIRSGVPEKKIVELDEPKHEIRKRDLIGLEAVADKSILQFDIVQNDLRKLLHIKENN